MERTFTRPAALAVVLTIAGVVAVPGPAVAQRATPAQQRIIDRIVELQREIDGLVAQLPPALRTQVREDLARPVEAGGALTTTTGARAAGGAATVGTGRSGSAPRSVDVFDRNNDGKLTSADRAWRALRIWIDTGPDGTMRPGEVTTAVDGAIREIDVGLRTFVRPDGTTGSVRRTDRIELDLKGDGFRSAAGILCVDIDVIAEMGFGVRSAGGQRLRGVQPLEAGWRVRGPDGTDIILR